MIALFHCTQLRTTEIIPKAKRKKAVEGIIGIIIHYYYCINGCNKRRVCHWFEYWDMKLLHADYINELNYSNERNYLKWCDSELSVRNCLFYFSLSLQNFNDNQLHQTNWINDFIKTLNWGTKSDKKLRKTTPEKKVLHNFRE